MSLPVVLRGEGRQIFESAEPIERLVLFLHIKFEISRREISGYIALLMDIPSLEQLRVLIADYVGTVVPDARKE